MRGAGFPKAVAFWRSHIRPQKSAARRGGVVAVMISEVRAQSRIVMPWCSARGTASEADEQLAE